MDIRAGKIWAYDIQPDDNLTNKMLRCELGSDGMALDTEGNLYLTGKGVIAFNPSVNKSRTLPFQKPGLPTLVLAEKISNPVYYGRQMALLHQTEIPRDKLSQVMLRRSL